MEHDLRKRSPDRAALAARNAVATVFALAGFAFSTWASRIPSVRQALDLGPGALGLLLLCAALGAVVSMPTAGLWVQRFGAAAVVAAAAVLDAVGMVLAGVGADGLTSVPLTAFGLLLVGFGIGSWDVAMNVEGAAVERLMRRSIMPRFHAAFSLGTVAGAAVGSLMAYLGFGIAWHVGVTGVLVAVLVVLSTRAFVPHARAPAQGARRGSRVFDAWAEPRTLVIGLMVLAMALTEGVANDWLGVALVDGYHAPVWMGAAGYALFVAAMTGGRLCGTVLIDSIGRAAVLWSSMGLAVVGVVLVVLGNLPVVVAAGIVLWGAGASLGFPIGMSAAADDPGRAAARVSVVSTIGYTAFLAGPPVVGFLGSHVGVLHALLLVSVVLVPSCLAVPAARRPT
jgi:MFS family permease